MSYSKPACWNLSSRLHHCSSRTFPEVVSNAFQQRGDRVWLGGVTGRREDGRQTWEGPHCLIPLVWQRKRRGYSADWWCSWLSSQTVRGKPQNWGKFELIWILARNTDILRLCLNKLNLVSVRKIDWRGSRWRHGNWLFRGKRQEDTMKLKTPYWLWAREVDLRHLGCRREDSRSDSMWEENEEEFDPGFWFQCPGGEWRTELWGEVKQPERCRHLDEALKCNQVTFLPGWR